MMGCDLSKREEGGVYHKVERTEELGTVSSKNLWLTQVTDPRKIFKAFDWWNKTIPYEAQSLPSDETTWKEASELLLTLGTTAEVWSF
jgi:hypothetical protein